jgi:cell division protein FtsI/penicillin-binding protein 2
MRQINNRTGSNSSSRVALHINRITALRAVFVVIGLVFVARLFYLQIIRRDYYKTAARSEQYRQLQIEPERGTIYMQNSSYEPVVLAASESRYTIIADPFYIKNQDDAAYKIADILKVDKTSVATLLAKKVRYVVLAKKVPSDQKDKVAALKIPGVTWQEQRIRTYPAGPFASQVLGFVNDSGDGQYGVEGAINKTLKGSPGQIKAITDVQGIPLVQNSDNVVKEPVQGTNILLSIDQTIQQISQDEIQKAVESAHAKSGSVIVIEADTGRIKSMANYPSYDVTNYSKVQDSSLFKNKVVSDPMEPGSIIKPLTVAAAIDQGVVSAGGSYYDSGVQTIDGVSVRNVTNLGAGDRSIFNILQYSLNTGAIYLLKQMGGGDVNEKARVAWHDYLSDHYRFTANTTVEQDEATIGYVPSPTEGDGLRVQYANTSFGQGISVTLQQVASAVSAVVNGGTYYNPTVVAGKKVGDDFVYNEPIVAKSDAVKRGTSDDVVSLMEHYVDLTVPEVKREGFIAGGKTGTAQVPKDGGGYRTDVYNATFAGFIGTKKPKYVIVVRVDEGSAAGGFSGFNNARPVFSAVANGIMDGIAF